MKLTEILSEHEIKIGLEAEDKMEAIEELIDLLISEHEISLRDRDVIIDAVFTRERSISTGVGEGVAIPHGSIDCVDEIVGSIGISPNGIDFDSFDGEPVFIVLLLLVPKTSFGKHIKTLAHIARTLSKPGIRDRIRSADSPEIVFDLIESAERDLGL
jgi:mannitol/fructose-specific phosphotransferase system IIA component (Ntr-type)